MCSSEHLTSSTDFRVNWRKEISDDGRYLFFNNAQFGRSVNLIDMDISIPNCELSSLLLKGF